MKMKQLFFGGLMLVAFTVPALQSKAQIGIRAGVNLSNVGAKDIQGDKIDTKIVPGFHAGLTFDIPVADEFYIQPGALFSTKGFKQEVVASSVANYTRKETPYYVEVPVNFIFKPELGNGNLLLGAGPYVAYGLGGKYKNDGNLGSLGLSTNGDLEFVNDYDDQSSTSDKSVYGKPLDYGGNLLVGYEFSNKLSAQLNAQLGMANLIPKNGGAKPDADAKFKNVGFGISLGYKF